MIGVDVVHVPRLRALLDRAPRFVDRYFTPEERHHAMQFSDPVVHLAGTFAAKEAVLKSTRAGPPVAYARRVELLRDADGAPYARLGRRRIAVSITHDGDVAIAVAIVTPAGRSYEP